MDAETVWNVIQCVHYTALVLWIGGIFFVGIMVPPSVHRSMASKAITGQIVGDCLRRLNTLEFLACFTLIATLLLSSRFVYAEQENLIRLFLTVLMMGFMTSVYRFYLTPKLNWIRENTPTLDDLSGSHPEKKKFRSFHRSYVYLIFLNFLFGLFVLYGSIVWIR